MLWLGTMNLLRRGQLGINMKSRHSERSSLEDRKGTISSMKGNMGFLECPL